MNTSGKWLFGLWAAFTILAGAILVSFHQPFRAPTPAILKLAAAEKGGRVRALHLVSASCGCSQRVMQHLSERGPLPGLTEQVVLLDGPAPGLEGTERLASRLIERGFALRRMSFDSVLASAQLHGVPLLVFAAPDDAILYMGGYGPGYDQDATIFHQLQENKPVQPLASIGCAVSKALRQQADPFHLKY